MRVNITKQVLIEGKGKRFCKVAIGANGKIRPNVVIVDGQEQTHIEGRYYIDFLQGGQRKRLAAGATAADAAHAAEKQTRELTAHNAAVAAGGVYNDGKPAAGSRLLKEAVDTYLLEVEAHKKRKTFAAYSTALKYFLESCPKQTLEQITRVDLLAFRTYLREKKDQSDRSVYNKFEIVMGFLKQHKITGLINKNDWPTFTEESVSTFTDDELQKFFAASNERQTLWFKFFYVTAMREQEVMYCSWSDIDFENKTVTVRENKRFGFKPKAYKGRLIPLTTELLDLLKDLKEKSDASCGLIFPTAGCKPKLDFLDECKAIAKRAGLSDFYLHKFRATRATHLLQDGIDIKSVQSILGHSDLESTMRYLGGQRTDVLQLQVERMESRF